MELKHEAIAGTLESSDAQVTVVPATGGRTLQVESSVMEQYGPQIKQVINETLDKLEVENAKVVVRDRGALDCTLKARVQTAVLRATDTTENLPWGTKL